MLTGSAEAWKPEDQERLQELDKTWGREYGRLSERVESGNATLEDVIDHEELFQAYPQLRNVRVEFKELPGNTQGYFFIDMNADPQLTETARCITARQDSDISKHKGEHSAVFIEDEPRAVVTPDKKTIRQQGRWIKEPNEPMFTLTVQDRHGILRYGRVRKLTPRECWRLQGFTDEQFDKAKASGLSDGRLYKMAGNAVSVPVVSAVGAVIKRIYQEQIQKG